MKPEELDQLVETVLYEGHILYPYRPSSKKNQQRFTFGRIYPEAYSRAEGGAEPCLMQTECLLRPAFSGAELTVEVRFLHPLLRQVGALEQPCEPQSLLDREPAFRAVPSLEAQGRLHQTWHEATERRIILAGAARDGAKYVMPFSFPAFRTMDPILDEAGRIPGIIVRRGEEIAGEVTVTIQAAGPGLLRLTVRILNRTSLPMAATAGADDALLLRTFASAHTILRAEGGGFVSLTAPAADDAAASAECRNLGAWPVLVGEETRGDNDTMLSSPIILPDYPQLAPESAGSLYDGTEIDEILTLRILAMTDAEKREMRQVDEHARRLLERTESLPNGSLFGMHGTMRPPVSSDDAIFGGNTRRSSAETRGIRLRSGDSVRIRPKARADVMDLALAGKVAVIEAIEEDAEGRIHLALVLDDDPGRDLGMQRQTGHRFFYGLDEIEPCAKGAEPR